MTTKHTPTPWHREWDGTKFSIGNESTRHDYLQFDYCVAHTKGNSMVDEANAAFIVRACNSYDDLLAALELFLDGMILNFKTGEVSCDIEQLEIAQKAAQAAIAKGESK